MNKVFVFDTNSLISAALIPESVNKKALLKAINLGILAISNQTLAEFVEVLFREKFDSYFKNDGERWEIIDEIYLGSEFFVPNVSIRACRDPKDDKYLELAVSVQADCIVTGDKNLLVLHPFRSIPIMNASDFLENF